MLRKLFFLMPLAVLISACGGGSGGGLTASPVSVSVAGLEVGESLDVSMETGNTVNTLTFSGTSTNPRNFPTRVLPGVSYRLSILNPPVGAGCVFVASQRTVFNGSDVVNDDTRVSCRGAIAGGGAGDARPRDIIQFVSAEPPVLGLRGSGAAGAPELSILEFVVRDNNGDVVEGELVRFTATSSLGGFQLNRDPAEGVTDEGGVVRVSVTSGAMPGSYGVIASLARDESISVQGNVTVTAGLPIQSRFSLAAEEFNIRGWNIVGTTTALTVRAADRLGNAVPDGVRVNFISELGQIIGDCEMSGGACSVDYSSLGSNQTEHFDPIRNTRTCNGFPCGHDRYGRSTVMAWMLGEEFFQDSSGDGLFAPTDNFTPLPEAFVDYNENGSYEGPTGAHIEDFVDNNEDGSYTPLTAGQKFKGISCDANALAAGHCENLAVVRSSLVIVNSTDNFQTYIYRTGSFVNSWQRPGGGAPQPSSAVPVTLPPLLGTHVDQDPLDPEITRWDSSVTAELAIVVADLNGNAPIAGTSISVDAGDLDIVGSSDCEVRGFETEPALCVVRIRAGDPLEAPFSEIEVTVSGPANERTYIIEVF